MLGRSEWQKVPLHLFDLKMRAVMSEISLDELRAELDSYAKTKPDKKLSPREQRIIAGFEEIEKFVEEQGRLPTHGEDCGIFERRYAVRLDQIRGSEECCEILKLRDSSGLLDTGSTFKSQIENPTEEELFEVLSHEISSENDITELTHVRSRKEINAAEDIAQRTPCEDFDTFKPIFETVQQDLKASLRKTLKYQDNARVNQGDLFVLDGQKVIVAEIGESFVGEHGRTDRRLRVLLHSLLKSKLHPTDDYVAAHSSATSY